MNFDLQSQLINIESQKQNCSLKRAYNTGKSEGIRLCIDIVNVFLSEMITYASRKEMSFHLEELSRESKCIQSEMLDVTDKWIEIMQKIREEPQA